MRKYNRRILTALVVAYKKGIINRKPLNKWLDFSEIYYHTMKYVSYFIIFSFIFVILDDKINRYDESIYFGKYFIQESKILSGLIIGIIAFNLYRLIKYYIQVYTVIKAMKQYKATEDDVEILNKVTFKIHV
ncbi:hypothetical protein KHQ81_13255 [Mycoplasmatota bacterium]|nr:hypothetical protein KHQ81_13255 [Mycoplasmatota bacterium]